MKSLFLKSVLAGLTLFVILNNLVFLPGNILSWDVFGYYLYLPLKFIYHDLGIHHEEVIQSIIEQYKSTGTFYQALKMPDGQYVMKYPMGMAVFYAPFFFIGHLIATLFKLNTDGFSAPYQLSILAGGMLYSLFGIWMLARVLLHYFSEKLSALVLFIVVFATNYPVHITMYGQNAMSHNVLFSMYACILFLSIRWHESFQWKHSLLLALTCGLTILSRPSEAVCLLIPALWGVHDFPSLKSKLTLIRRHGKQVLLFFLILLLIGLPQFLYWKMYSGKFLFNSYGGNAGEGFEFMNPHLAEVLFSFRKGWLIYTPVMIMALLGFMPLYRRNKGLFFSLFVYLTVSLFIISSWTCWWYAHSYSQRTLIPSYPVLAIALGYFLSWLAEQKKSWQGIGFSLIAVFGVLNLFQTMQFHLGVIDGERMTKEYYMAVFGKLNATEEDKKLLLVNRSFAGKETLQEVNDYESVQTLFSDFENTVSSNHQTRSRTDSVMIGPHAASELLIAKPYHAITAKDHAWLRVSAWVNPTLPFRENPCSVIVHFSHRGYPYKYIPIPLNDSLIQPHQWNAISFDYLTPEVRSLDDSLKVFFLNNGNAPVYVDDLKAEIYERKETEDLE
jgi:hypothetical protein